MQQTDADKKSGQVENIRTVREYVRPGTKNLLYIV